MFIRIVTFISSILLLSSCGGTKQYDVYAINNTSENLTLTLEKENGTETITLAPQERKRIVSTDFIETDHVRTRAEDCRLVANDIKAANAQGKPSKLLWCSPDVTFNVVDIGQGEFELNYKDQHFH